MDGDPWLQAFHRGNEQLLTQTLARLGECSLLASIPSPFAAAFRCPGTSRLVPVLLNTPALLPVIDRPDDQGKRALWWALGQARVSLLELLLKSGASPHLPNSQGMSPAQFATWMGETEALLALQRAGADLKVDFNGRGIVELAMESRNEACLFFLLNGQHIPLERPSACGTDLVEQALRKGLYGFSSALLEARSKALAQTRSVVLDRTFPFARHAPPPPRL